MPEVEDILDGYFPLATSISDLMMRRGLRHARLSLSFAPIIEVAGLSHDGPVPLNIRSGRAGMILWAELFVAFGPQGARLTGQARWHWLDGAEPAPSLDPMIRLAEPALVRIAPKKGAAGLSGIATATAGHAGGPSAIL